MVTKKEYFLQYVAIWVSLLAVFASVFAGFMAYKASILSAEISWNLTKDNEIESRNFEKRTVLYPILLEEVSFLPNYINKEIESSLNDTENEQIPDVFFENIKQSNYQIFASRKIVYLVNELISSMHYSRREYLIIEWNNVYDSSITSLLRTYILQYILQEQIRLELTGELELPDYIPKIHDKINAIWPDGVRFSENPMKSISSLCYLGNRCKLQEEFAKIFEDYNLLWKELFLEYYEELKKLSN